MPKFDVVVGNPPYKQKLHLKFLDLAIELSTQYILFVEPGGWLLDERIYSPIRLKTEKPVKDKLNLYGGNIELFNSKKYFDVELVLKNASKTMFADNKYFMVVSIDTNVTKEITDSHSVRLFAHTIQKFRKEMQLSEWNPIEVYYKSDSEEFDKLIVQNLEAIIRKIEYPIINKICDSINNTSKIINGVSVTIWIKVL